MEDSMISSSRIKSKIFTTVKRTRAVAATAFGFMLCMTLAFGESDRANPTELPSIEAKTYSTTVVRRSASKKVYLFSARPGESEPSVGKIVLLKKESEPIIALRVLKTYPDKNRFAAKEVRIYQGNPTLAPHEQFTAVEKIADVIPQPIPPTAQDKADLKELESVSAPSPIPSPDPALVEPSPLPSPSPELSFIPSPLPSPVPSPVETVEAPPLPSPSPVPEPSPTASETPNLEPTPEPLPSVEPSVEPTPEPTPIETSDIPRQDDEKKEEKQSEEKGEKPEPQPTDSAEEDDHLKNLEIEEVYPLDPFNHSFTGGFAFLRNVIAPDTTSTATALSSKQYASGGAKYGYTFAKMLFLKRPMVQDSVTVETGLYFYRINGFSPTDPADSYSILPVLITARYNLLLGDNMALFLYAGVLQNFVVHFAGTAENKGFLQSHFPAGGGGFFFHIGPSWDVRLDLGYDDLGLGLVLRF